MQELKVGQIVASTKGRDLDKLYLVWHIIDKDFVLLVDGDNKKIDHPKKKRIKHIRAADMTLENISEKISANKKVFDSEIYSAIKKFKESNLQEEEVCQKVKE